MRRWLLAVFLLMGCVEGVECEQVYIPEQPPWPDAGADR